jgi:hypothetical protein
MERTNPPTFCWRSTIKAVLAQTCMWVLFVHSVSGKTSVTLFLPKLPANRRGPSGEPLWITVWETLAYGLGKNRKRLVVSHLLVLQVLQATAWVFAFWLCPYLFRSVTLLTCWPSFALLHFAQWTSRGLSVVSLTCYNSHLSMFRLSMCELCVLFYARQSMARQ